MHQRRRSFSRFNVFLAAGLLAGAVAPASAQEAPRLEAFLSPDVREAFAAAAAHDELWQVATRDGEAYLRERGIEVPRDLSVSYLNVLRQGDWVVWADDRFAPLLEMYCPPVRTWWQECRKVMRVCETKQVTFCRATTNPDPKDACYPKETASAEAEVNCHMVCESSIWDKEFTPPTFPPFPPFPLGGR